MRRLALYGCVHANLPALEAVLASMHAEGVTERYCLGDLVGYGPHPAEVIERVRALGDPVVQGNYDRAIGEHLHDSGSEFATPQDTLDGAESFAFTMAAVDARDEQFLSARAREIVIEQEGARLLLCHGSPRRVSERIMPEASGSLLVSLIRDADVHVVCCAHVHVPFHRSIPTERGVVHWINAGSVGRPRDGDPRAAWMELLLGTHADVLARAPEDLACRRVGESDLWLGTRVHRLAYDVEAVAAQMVAAGLPITLAAGLRTASEEHAVLAPTSVTYRIDQAFAPEAPIAGCDDETVSDGDRYCTCALKDRITSYVCFSIAFRDGAGDVEQALPRLFDSMRSCRKNPYVDDDVIDAAYQAAQASLGTAEGRAAFLAERMRLYGVCNRFDPFNHVLSISELTYLSGDDASNRAMLEEAYAQAGFVPRDAEDACLGHISVELAFMAHCLRGRAGHAAAVRTARAFFVTHLADWAVLFAVVTAQQAQDPVMRYLGLALDKYLICEAGTFRTAVPEHCDARVQAL